MDVESDVQYDSSRIRRSVLVVESDGLYDGSRVRQSLHRFWN